MEDLLSPEELASRADELARVAEDTSGGGDLELLPFRIAAEWLALPLGDVLEVLPRPRLTWVPFAPLEVAGVMNLRGSIIPVIDVGRLFTLDRTDGGDRWAIILAGGASPVAFLADGVDPLLRAQSANVQPPLATTPRDRLPFISGALLTGARLVTLLDSRAVVAHVLSPRSAEDESPLEGGIAL